MSDNSTTQPHQTPANTKSKKFCRMCGEQLAVDADQCPSCGHVCAPHTPPQHRPKPEDISPKSFGVAVSLCGVFGILGIHHFYLGNIVHGLIDFLLFVAAMVCFFNNSDGWILFGMLLLMIDIGHSVWVMYMLFTGRTHDSKGKLVAYPGQF